MISELVKKYELEKIFPPIGKPGYYGYNAETVLEVIIFILSRSYTSKGNRNESILFNYLIASKKPITEILIIRGGVPYKFNKDGVILEMFRDAIDGFNNPNLTKQELHEEVEEWYQHFIEQVRPLYNKLTHLKPRQRHLLIHELLGIAGYPFTPQQRNAGDQAKASLIRNWLKRSTPKISSSTVNHIQKNYPDINLTELYPQFFKEHESISTRNKKSKKRD